MTISQFITATMRNKIHKSCIYICKKTTLPSFSRRRRTNFLSCSDSEDTSV